MTNHDENTQGETVADTPGRPRKIRVAVDAALVGLSAGFLAYLVVSLPDEPRWYDWAGMACWAGLISLYLASLIKLVRRRWAKEPTGYMDREGDQWYVMADGRLALNPRDDAPGATLEDVRQDYGPLTPIYG